MPKKIKALLLSAGLGTRLRPLTFEIPKCLVEVDNKPILEHWLHSLEKVGCDETIINTHYLHEKVCSYLKRRVNKKMKIKQVYEEKLQYCHFEEQRIFNDSRIIMIHADNMTKFNLLELLEADEQKPKNCLMTMLTFTTDSPKSCGVVERDSNMIVKNFFEKVENPPSNIANGAIYIFDSSLLEKLSATSYKLFDFSKDVIPLFLGRIFSHHTEEAFIDIGTHKNLAKARFIFETQI